MTATARFMGAEPPRSPTFAAGGSKRAATNQDVPPASCIVRAAAVISLEVRIIAFRGLYEANGASVIAAVLGNLFVTTPTADVSGRPSDLVFAPGAGPHLLVRPTRPAAVLYFALRRKT